MEKPSGINFTAVLAIAGVGVASFLVYRYLSAKIPKDQAPGAQTATPAAPAPAPVKTKAEIKREAAKTKRELAAAKRAAAIAARNAPLRTITAIPYSMAGMAGLSA